MMPSLNTEVGRGEETRPRPLDFEVVSWMWANSDCIGKGGIAH